MLRHEVFPVELDVGITGSQWQAILTKLAPVSEFEAQVPDGCYRLEIRGGRQ
ncbi:MAG: hypothetical protein U5J83_08115 [Bryobacterales bacterium]|nr:hypothetical protein [Bryobacterales bacterium]